MFHTNERALKNMTTIVDEKMHREDEFKSKLVNDVFGKDSGLRIPIEKIMLLIWQFRDDPGVVKFMAQFVAKVSLKGCMFLFFVWASSLILFCSHYSILEDVMYLTV